jgi:hypothetical protein
MVTRIQSFSWVDALLESARSDIGAEWPNEMDLESPNGPACTLIQTANSSYLFFMTAPDERRGLLVGGPLGESPANAIFVGAMPNANAAEDVSSIRQGSRAVFDIAFEGGFKRVITSPVVKVVRTQIDSCEPRVHLD